MGIIGHSTALLSDGINSTSDVAYYIVVKIFMKLAGQPPDPEHPYGHRQMESIAALIVGSFVITTAIAIFWTAVNGIFDQWQGKAEAGSANLGALWVAPVHRGGQDRPDRLYPRRRGKDRQPGHPRPGFRPSQRRLFGPGRQRGHLFGPPGPPLGRPSGRRPGRPAHPAHRHRHPAPVHRRPDGSRCPAISWTARIRSVLDRIPDIRSVEEIHAHRFGPYFVINLTIGIDGAMDVRSGDAIATRVEEDVDRTVSRWCAGFTSIITRRQVVPPRAPALKIFFHVGGDLFQARPADRGGRSRCGNAAARRRTSGRAASSTPLFPQQAGAEIVAGRGEAHGRKSDRPGLGRLPGKQALVAREEIIQQLQVAAMISRLRARMSPRWRRARRARNSLGAAMQMVV